MKRCPHCGETKELNEFNKSNQTKSGRTCYCKECIRKMQKEHYSQPGVREKHIAKCREYRKNHLEQEKRNHKRYREEHKEEVNRKKLEYAKNHREWVNKIVSNWFSKNADKHIQYNSARRALVASAPGNGITSEEWGELVNKYGNKCLACGATDRRLTIDHVIPLSVGGAHDIRNVQPLCKKCNSSKGTKTIDYRPNLSDFFEHLT